MNKNDIAMEILARRKINTVVEITTSYSFKKRNNFMMIKGNSQLSKML